MAFGAVAPASAQIRKGAKQLTPKRIGSDRMPAANYAPVVSAISLPVVLFQPHHSSAPLLLILLTGSVHKIKGVRQRLRPRQNLIEVEETCFMYGT